MTNAAALTPAMRADIVRLVESQPAVLEADRLTRVVAEVAVLATSAEAAGAYRIALDAAEREEIERIEPIGDTAPQRVGAGYGWWSVIAATLGLVAPVLVIAGWVSSSAPEPVSLALASGIAMLVALGLFAWLEPRRTSSPLYRGGNFAGGLFIFYAVLWACAPLILFGRMEDVLSEPGAVLGLVLQVLAVLGCVVLAPVAIRHDRDRPQWAGGERVRPSLVPDRIAADPEFRARVDARLAVWRRQAYPVFTPQERAALQAAEFEVVRLLTERGTLTADRSSDAERCVRDRGAWS
jgi:hypothetical protein